MPGKKRQEKTIRKKLLQGRGKLCLLSGSLSMWAMSCRMEVSGSSIWPAENMRKKVNSENPRRAVSTFLSGSPFRTPIRTPTVQSLFSHFSVLPTASQSRPISAGKKSRLLVCHGAGLPLEICISLFRKRQRKSRSNTDRTTWQRTKSAFYMKAKKMPA